MTEMRYNVKRVQGGGGQKPGLELLFLLCCLNDDDTYEDYFLCGMCLCVFAFMGTVDCIEKGFY